MGEQGDMASPCAPGTEEGMERLQAKNARAVDERHDGDDVLVHSIDNPVVPHNEFPVRTAFIFRNLPARFGDVV